MKELLYQESISDSVRLLGISLSNLNIHSKKVIEIPIAVQFKFEF